MGRADTDYTAILATRESPDSEYKHDYIDVVLDTWDGGWRVLRFDVDDDEIARFRYEITEDGKTEATGKLPTYAAARYIDREMDVRDVRVVGPNMFLDPMKISQETPISDIPEGITRAEIRE